MTTTFLTGQRLTADLLNTAFADVDQEPYVQIAASTNSAAITTETVSLTVPSAVYKAGKAYRLWMGGGVTYSNAAGFSSWQVKKGTTTAGTLLLLLSRLPIGGHTNEIHLNMQGVFVIGASDVTTQLVLTLTAGGTGTSTHNGSTAGNPRHVSIFPAGDASAWSNRPVLS